MYKPGKSIPLNSLNDRPISGLYIRYVAHKADNKPSILELHRDDFFIFLLQESGESHLMVDFKESNMKGRCINCILPGSVHQMISEDCASGWFIGVAGNHIDGNFRTKLYEGRSGSSLPITSEQYQQMESIAQALYKEQERGGGPIIAIATHLVSAFAGCLVQYQQASEVMKSSGRAENITAEFLRYMREQFMNQKSPAWYAAKLNISRSYLNECVKSIAGQTVTALIQQEAILESKRLLAHSNLTVREITYQLGFESPSYFNRLFFKVAKEQPLSFRKKYHH